MSHSSKWPPGFKAYLSRAKELVGNLSGLNAISDDSGQKFNDQKNRLSKVVHELEVLIRFTKAFASGRYRDTPLQSLIMIAAGLLYFVNPFDMVHDWLPVVGFLDDATVIAFVFNAVRKDLDKFTLWEKQNPPS